MWWSGGKVLYPPLRGLDARAMGEGDRKPITIRIPQDTRPSFSNATQVNVTDDSVAIQFAYVRPGGAEGELLAEVVLTSKHAIDFSRALDATIKKHFTRHLGSE